MHHKLHFSLTEKKRIQAAQERARLAEQKEKQAKEAASLEVQRKVEQERIQKAQSALRSVAGRALEDKQRSIMAQLEGTKEVVALDEEQSTMQQSQQQQQQPEAGIPIMKSLDPPPPSFDSMKFPPPKEMQQQIQHPHLSSNSSSEMVGHGMNSRVLNNTNNKAGAPPPPSFDFVEQQMGVVESSAPPAPTAPSISPGATVETTTHETTELHHLHGIMPVAAPPLSSHQPTQVNMPPPPPSFAVFESQQQQQQQQQVEAPGPSSAEQGNITVVDDDDCLAYDENGNPLSPEQRQALLDEQRLLYENIMKEKAANDAAIAQANADAFDLRSSSAAARAMSGGATATSSNLVDSNRVMDSVGRNVEPTTTAAAGSSSSAAAAGTDTTDEATRRESRRMVQIGNNQMVALHGQDRTKKAIKEGTAILVQCINCQNWMQVTDTATLMFCPVCQVVSPVIHQNEVMTKEEAIQLTMDRKLAEKLQAEAYEQGGSSSAETGGETKQDEGYLARFFGGIGGFVADATDGAVEALSSSPTTSTTTAAGGGEQERSDSWWNKISSIVSYGVEHDRGELGVTRPPGAPASQYPAAQQRGSTTATVSGRSPTHHNDEETRGLLSPVVVDGNEANLPSGRVAEQRPLFSCVMDSVNSATAAVFSTGEDVEGIDSSSLLVTNAGRGVEESECDYEQLPDRS